VVAIEVLAGNQPLNEKKLVSGINSYVERYTSIDFNGVLKIVLEDLTVLRNLRTLHLLNRYYELTEITRGFKITLDAFDPNKKRLISLSPFMK